VFYAKKQLKVFPTLSIYTHVDSFFIFLTSRREWLKYYHSLLNHEGIDNRSIEIE